MKDSTEPLRVNLAWTDYPGSAATQGALVNDLDLSITDPSGSIHYPDNKKSKSDTYYSYYNSADIEYAASVETKAVAVHFTPESKPFTPESINIFFNKPENYKANITIKIYKEEINEANLLYTKSLVYRDNEDLRDLGYVTFDVDYDQPIDSDVYIVVEDDNDNIFVRFSSVGKGHSFVKSEYDGAVSWIQMGTLEFAIDMTAKVESNEKNYDHANNLVGITIDGPAPGDYTVHVSG